MKAEKKCFDVVIIGGGPAGLSAALWCAELKLSAVVLEQEKEFGGQLLWTYNSIENHLGITAKNGRELCDIFLRQLEDRTFTRCAQTKIVAVNLKEKTVYVNNGTELSGKAIVIATGVRRRKLNIPGEDLFRGKGIIESGKKDAEEIENKKVLIVGGGDAALENALILAEHAERVYLIHRRNEFRGRKEFIEKIRENKKIEVLLETELLEISGKENVEMVTLKDSNSGKTQKISVAGVLLRIGIAANTELFQGQIAQDENGYVKIDSNCHTNIEGVFAVGDVANPISPTVSSAVGMGASAVKEILIWLNA